MPAERTIMRQVREVLRSKFVGGVPISEIARRIGVAASTVRATIRRFQAAGLSWPLSEEMTDVVLEVRRRRHQARSPSSSRAGLGEYSSRAQAQARNEVLIGMAL
jgi:transposase-like protein